MKIKMRTRAASAAFTANPGEIVDRPEAEAKDLCRGGYADPVAEAHETAAAPAAPETAAKPPAPAKPAKGEKVGRAAG